MFYHLSWSNISNPFKPCIPLQLRISALRCATVPRYLEAVSRMIVSPPGEALELAQGPARGGLNNELAQQNLEMLGLCVLSSLSKIGYMYIQYPPNHYPMVYHHISSFFDWKILNMVYFQNFPDISNICPYLEMLDEGCGVFEERLLQSLQSLQSTGNVCIWTERWLSERADWPKRNGHGLTHEQFANSTRQLGFHDQWCHVTTDDLTAWSQSRFRWFRVDLYFSIFSKPRMQSHDMSLCQWPFGLNRCLFRASIKSHIS